MIPTNKTNRLVKITITMPMDTMTAAMIEIPINMACSEIKPL